MQQPSETVQHTGYAASCKNPLNNFNWSKSTSKAYMNFSLILQIQHFQTADVHSLSEISPNFVYSFLLHSLALYLCLVAHHFFIWCSYCFLFKAYPGKTCTQAWYYSQINSTYKTPVSFHVLDELQSGIIRFTNKPVLADILYTNWNSSKIPAVTVITEKLRRKSVQVAGICQEVCYLLEKRWPSWPKRI